VRAGLATADFDAERELVALGATPLRDVAENGIRFTTFPCPEGTGSTSPTS
jgi:hypothetical protein